MIPALTGRGYKWVLPAQQTLDRTYDSADHDMRKNAVMDPLACEAQHKADVRHSEGSLCPAKCH
jgi:hypothetical protein